MQQYDLIIVGGGLVGASLAVALRHSNLRLALVDARSPACNDPRLLALNYSSCEFLKNLNCWSALMHEAAAIHQVHVSRAGHFGAVRLDRADACLSSLGHVIPARLIEAALLQEIKTLSNITLYQPAQLTMLQQDEQQATLIIKTEAGELTLQSKIVIGADGTDSTVRAQLGIATDVTDYQQSAIVTRTTLARSHQHIAYERFTTSGAIAMLPLLSSERSETECATIWTADNATIKALLMLNNEVFLTQLQQQFGYRLGRLIAIQQRHVFPVKMVKAKQVVQQRVFLLGNAAHTLHPIAAQGLNLSLYEVAILAEFLHEKSKQQVPIKRQDLQAISASIQAQQAASTNVSHRLAKLFASQATLASLALQCGMISLDTITPLKTQFINKIIGRTGAVPRLLLSAYDHDNSFT